MKKNFYLTNAGRLSRKDNTLLFQPLGENGKPNGPPRRLPIEGVRELYAFGPLELNASALNFLGRSGVGVRFFDYYGNFTGSFEPREQQQAGQILAAQADCYLTPEKRLFLARAFVEGSAHGMARNLKYHMDRGKDDLAEAWESGRELATHLPQQTSIETLMSLEAHIRKTYYACFDRIVEGRMRMDGRSYRPPHNGMNALISFLNALCYAEVLRAMRTTAINPTLSFLHQPGARRFSLALDVAEIFKPLLVDRLLFRLINKGQIKDASFETDSRGFWLKDTPKKAVLKAWDENLSATIKHRKLKRNVSYRTLMRMEAHKLTAHFSQIKTYEPFKLWW